MNHWAGKMDTNGTWLMQVRRGSPSWGRLCITTCKAAACCSGVHILFGFSIRGKGRSSAGYAGCCPVCRGPRGLVSKEGTLLRGPLSAPAILPSVWEVASFPSSARLLAEGSGRRGEGSGIRSSGTAGLVERSLERFEYVVSAWDEKSEIS